MSQKTETELKLEREVEELRAEVESLVDDKNLPHRGFCEGEILNEKERTTLVRSLDALFHAIQLGPTHPARVDAAKKLEEFKREVGVWG